MTKRELLKRLKLELWVSDKLGVSTTAKEHQSARLPVYFTIGEVRAMVRVLETKPRKR